MDSPMRRSNTHLHGVQAARAIAALLVVVSHSILSLVAKAGLDPRYQDYGWSSGEVGVRIFFAISGFIMVFTSSELFATPGAVRGFYFKRLARVVPLYYLTTSLYACKLTIQHGSVGVADLVRSLLFIPYVNSAGLFQPVYGLGWTLNYEMLFYAMFAAALVLPFRAGLIAICTALSALVLTGAVIPAASGSGVTMQWLRFASNPIMVYFLIGVLVGAVRVRAPLSAAPWSLTTTVTVCTVMALTAVATPRGAFLPIVTSGVAAACLIVTGLRQADSRSTDDPRVRLFTSLGDASYSIYLTHSFIVGPAARAWSAVGAPVAAWPLFVVAMLLSCSILGLITFRFIERPIAGLVRSLVSIAHRDNSPSNPAPESGCSLAVSES
jgi:exopolysaccharide production protein ExoZ